jgi:hypothetical protein
MKTHAPGVRHWKNQLLSYDNSHYEARNVASNSKRLCNAGGLVGERAQVSAKPR